MRCSNSFEFIQLALNFCVSRNKPELQNVRIEQGDAEELPFDTDSKDRYVSAGSIEYWPEPQRGICEAYRVLRPGGLACIIGPVYPTNPISRLLADIWFGPSLLVLAVFVVNLTCEEVMQDAFPHRTGVHRMVSQRRLQGCSNYSHRTLVVPWSSKVAACRLFISRIITWLTFTSNLPLSVFACIDTYPCFFACMFSLRFVRDNSGMDSSWAVR